MFHRRDLFDTVLLHMSSQGGLSRDGSSRTHTHLPGVRLLVEPLFGWDT